MDWILSYVSQINFYDFFSGFLKYLFLLYLTIQLRAESKMYLNLFY